MSVRYTHLDEITQTELETLVANEVPESQILDYKRDLFLDRDEARAEFAADLSAFANASGGDLIYGISEKGGVPSEISGMGLDDPDAMVQRMDNIARDKVDPRILGLQWRWIRLASGSYVIVGRVPKSWVGPHIVTMKGTPKFFSRNSTGKYRLAAGEIRELFAVNQGIENRVRAFRDDRLGAIVANEVPVPVFGPKYVLHLIPFDAPMPFESNDRAHRLFDDDWLMENEHHLMALVPAGGPGRIRDRFLTLDGLVLCGVNRGLNASETAEYTHLFQHGAVESVGNDHLSRYVDENTQERSLLAYDFEEDVLQRIDHCLALQRSLGVEPPLLLTLAMLEVRGFQWRAVGRQLSHHAVHPFDRDTLMLRPVVMPEWPEGTARSVQPVFDSLANAAGWPRSPYFDKTGDRIRPLF